MYRLLLFISVYVLMAMEVVCQAIPMFQNNYIGGISTLKPNYVAKYNTPPDISSGVIKVNSLESLIKAIKSVKPGGQIVIASGKYDITNSPTFIIPSNVKIIGSRGQELSTTLISNNYSIKPIFNIIGDNVLIYGLSLQGPDSSIINTPYGNNIDVIRKQFGATSKRTADILKYGKGSSGGIFISGKNVTIENCEIANFSNAAISVQKDADVKVHHCFIHHNQRYSLGYGIMVSEGNAEIYANIFDFNRHSVASTGLPNSSYNVHDNIFLEHCNGHAIDVHGGKDRGDGTNIAGKLFIIENNTFYNRNCIGIMLRGRPTQQMKVLNNKFLYLKKADQFKQTNASGNTDVSY
jgi:hypothetical protein